VHGLVCRLQVVSHLPFRFFCLDSHGDGQWLGNVVFSDDVDHLLQIPIRRISLYDINKNREEVAAINARLKEIARLLKNLTGCAIDYLGSMLEKFKKLSPAMLERKTTVTSFSAVDVKAVETPVTNSNNPDMYTGAEAWILAGGAHHTSFTYDLSVQQMVDWAEQNAPSGSAAYRAFALAHARFCVQKLLNGIGE